MTNSQFIFKGYDSNLEKGEVLFHFGFKGEKNIDFTEKISFPPVTNKIPETLLKSLLDNLMLILGISYWKLYCPKEIVIESNFLNEKQAKFWNIVYTKGMGEFYYKNKIDFRGLVNFPFSKKAVSAPINFSRKNRSLVGIGGGKDSIVSADLLKESNKQFDLVTSGFPIQIEIAKMIGGGVINTFRQIDPKLLEIVKQKDVYNGHIPISVYYAFLTILMAVLFDYKYVIVSNEKSANYGSVEYLGEMINHQWSKSFEFEKLFREYVSKNIIKDIEYFSLIRPLTEIRVVELFSEYKKYFSVFSSCNTNFKLTGDASKKWCGKCAKCAFVFALLSAFVSKEELIRIFGKNLYEDKNLLLVFEELLGIKNFKPFACVGTPEEMQLAMFLAYKKGVSNNDAVMKMFMEKVLPKIKNIYGLEKEIMKQSSDHAIPQEFLPIIKGL